MTDQQRIKHLTIQAAQVYATHPATVGSTVPVAVGVSYVANPDDQGPHRPQGFWRAYVTCGAVVLATTEAGHLGRAMVALERKVYDYQRQATPPVRG